MQVKIAPQFTAGRHQAAASRRRDAARCCAVSSAAACAKSAAACKAGSTGAGLRRDFKNELDFDRHAEGKAGDPEDDAGRQHPGAEDLDEEFGGAVGDFRMVPEVALRRDIDAELRHAGYPVERAEIRLGGG